jgi:tRNA(fMet)-specific endonuclease VapC
MTFLFDTNIAILLRDRVPEAITRIGVMEEPATISIITHVELEGGVYAKPDLIGTRREALDILLDTLEVIPFEERALQAYSRIVAASGYSRRRILDRMIAATALVHNLTLVTSNGDDFYDIPGLKLKIETF